MSHRWSEKTDHPLAHKSERECLNGCGIVKVTRHEFEGGRETHWTEFWRGLDRIECEGTPACEPAESAVKFRVNQPQEELRSDQ